MGVRIRRKRKTQNILPLLIQAVQKTIKYMGIKLLIVLINITQCNSTRVNSNILYNSLQKCKETKRIKLPHPSSYYDLLSHNI